MSHSVGAQQRRAIARVYAEEWPLLRPSGIIVDQCRHDVVWAMIGNHVVRWVGAIREPPTMMATMPHGG